MSKGKRLNPFEHALKRPDTYIGSAKTIDSKIWVFDSESKTAVQKEIAFNPGLFNIVREILSNVIDNVWRSHDTDTPTKNIKIIINQDEITVWNDGLCIPVEKTNYDYTDPRSGKVIKESLYPAEVFFGDMFAGTNYDDEEVRKTSGRNGMGAKAANVFSSKFTVECTNPDSGKKFVQVYTKNGTERSKPKLLKYENKPGYTKITIVPDYEYFKYPSTTEFGMDENLISLLNLYCHEVAMITGIPVSFKVDKQRATIIRIKTLEKYARLFFPDTSQKSVYIKAPNGDEAVLIEGGVPEMDEERNISHISFVNGIRTKGGGIHVNAWRDSLVSPFVKAFNAKKRPGHVLKTSAKAVYPYLQLFVRVEVDRPRFGSQTKDELTEVFSKSGKSIKYSLHSLKDKLLWESEIKKTMVKIMKWGFVSDLENKLLAKIDKTLTRAEGSNRINIDPAKLTDANRAGTKDSGKCRLFITEGLSAKAFATRGVSTMGKEGKDFNGSYAIRGKFLNVQNASKAVAAGNKEIQELKRVIGLQRGVDYSDPNNLKKLRYGSVCILTDADDDGIHIRGLLLNFFFTEFPQLMDLDDFLYSFSTPVTSATLKKAIKKDGVSTKRLLFYSNPEFKTWFEKNSEKVSDAKYYKGLGSVNPKDTPGYFKNQKVVRYTKRGDEKKFMSLGFDKNFSNERKPWIIDSIDNGDSDFIYQGDLCLSSFVDDQLIIYHKMALRRSLPCIIDGFKESQRKIFFTALMKNYKKTVGLVNMTGAVKEMTGYHHSETSLYDTTIKMAQGYVGSNNIPLLENDGEFGTREVGGKNSAAPRYISTKAESIARLLFSVEDDPLLENLVEDNKEVEYDFFVPIIPMILVNGAEGIATGFSTNIPNYNPMDIVQWIENWLKKDSQILAPLKPWYRDHTGEVEMKKNAKGEYTGWTSKGILTKLKTKQEKWEISELPVGIWTKNFEEWLNYLKYGTPPTGSTKKWPKKDKRITGYDNYCTANTVSYVITPTKYFTPDENTAGNLKSYMINSFSLNNMVAITEKNYPKKFSSAEEILEYFCPVRLNYYVKRKSYMMNVLKTNLTKTSNKYRFVKGNIDKELNIHQTDEDLDQYLEKKNFDRVKTKTDERGYDYLLSMQFRSMTVRRLEELEKERNGLEEKIKVLEPKGPKRLWREDLAKFKKEYPIFVKSRTN